MIIKKIKRANLDKTKAGMISTLVDYIFSEHDREGVKKLAHAGAFNFLSTTRAGQKNEMIALAEDSVRSPMPVAHWIMSWSENEIPTKDDVDYAVRKFLWRMGWKNHQAFYALHTNTHNQHVHIVVNRADPYTTKVVRPNNGFDIEEAHRALAIIEEEQGWKREERQRYVVRNGVIYRNKTAKIELTHKPEAEQFENQTGEKSAQRIAQERGYAVIKNAHSWRDLHAGLSDVGLRFTRKGSGALIWIGETAIKASSVDRSFSMPKLVKRLGEFEEGNYPEERSKVEPEPVSHVAEELWRAYQRQRQIICQKQVQAQKEKKQAEDDLKEQHRREQETMLERLARHGLSILNISRHFLGERQKKERRELKATLRVRPRASTAPSFKNWLIQKGQRRSVQLWRLRRRIRPGMKIEAFNRTYLSCIPPSYGYYRKYYLKEHERWRHDSLLDCKIALLMRKDNHKPEAIARAVFDDSPYAKALQNPEERKMYCNKVIDYAINPPGDIELCRLEMERQAMREFLKRHRLEEDDGPRLRM